SGIAGGRQVDGQYGLREVQIYGSLSTQAPAGRPAGLGRGPGLAEVNGPNLPPNVTSQAPVQNPAPAIGTPLPPPPTGSQSVVGASPSGNQSAQITGPVDFTIVLETASGKGYP
ncbi:MAG TPA: hypothetical protein VMW65_07065, partial [Chloroflexota bacterium]|nr:hypothetical protein [Chloroflexota bacterium]